MPVITVHGIPCVTTHLSVLRQQLCEAVAAIPELRLTADQTTVFFPGDLLPPDRVELIVIVHGLFQHHERTPGVRQSLAEALRSVVVHFTGDHVPRCKRVEVIINAPFDPTMGFAPWTPITGFVSSNPAP
jgi:hypothetical protein